MERDPVDRFIEQWNRERPDLDPAALGIVSRVLMLAKLLEHSADRALERFGLSLWQFDVLAALRRSGPPFKLSPTRLMQLVTLTSGAMTNRIDRLEELGLVAREPHPGDRRGLLIALTRDGRKLVDEAIEVRLADAQRSTAGLSTTEARTLAALLRSLLRPMTNGNAPRAARRQLARSASRPVRH
ncbi:MAG: MarR family winged helix-turn-helix transcriptional regulator [Phycisphaerae bacterium]